MNKWLILACVCLLAACGGGGGGGSSSVRPDMPDIPESTTPPEAEEESEITEEPEDSPWTYLLPLPEQHPTQLETVPAGVSSELALDMMRDHKLADNARYVVRHESAPTVYAVDGTTDHQLELLHYAVNIINRVLPDEWHLEIGETLSRGPRFNEISINFVDPDPDTATAGRTFLSFETEEGSSERPLYLRNAAIWVDGTEEDDRETLGTLVHEILHGLGLNHIDAIKYMGSVMALAAGSYHEVHEIDGTALRLLYTRFGLSTAVEDLTIESLGEWETSQISLSGTIGDGMTYGVTRRQGVLVPWARWGEIGEVAETDLVENPLLEGTATWVGYMAGFTPGLESVVGDTQISIDMTTLDGSAEFTGLQYWEAGQAPEGVGTTWGDGDLHYSISVSGNYLRNTGGDDGALSGAFYHPQHQYLGGTLERPDLTAAFGSST